MTALDVLCLAHSNKMGASCIAGLRLDGGGWIRPVSANPHGELHPVHYILHDGSCPRNFDVLRISFEGPKPAAHQPENWLIADKRWELIARSGPAEFAPLLKQHAVEGPTLLGDYSRSIPAQRFEAKPAASSLCLIRPGRVRWKIENRPNGSNKVRAEFGLKGTSYSLPVTDPAWSSAFRSLLPGEYPSAECGMPAEPDVLFTVSLGDPWEDGCCYKLIAAILHVQFDGMTEPSSRTTSQERSEVIERSMNSARAARIIGTLALGIDPFTQVALPRGHPLSHPETLKALRAAESALLASSLSKESRQGPAQAGSPWLQKEEDVLVREFNRGESIAAIARAHARSTGAIKARLVRLGLIE